MYPKQFRRHLQASVAAAGLFGIGLGYWLAERASVSGPLEAVVVGLGSVVLISLVFSWIDATLLPR